MKYLFVSFAALVLLSSCTRYTKQPELNDCKREIIQTEKEFEKMAEDKGLAEAFSFFASDSAAIRARGKIILGKTEIRNHYNNLPYKNVSLSWSPDFVDVSSSCDLGYTYGKYKIAFTDSLGKNNSDSGYFHTVWKKQKDGKWRFVWD